MRYQQNLEGIDKHSIVLICGLYKTCTSLTVQLLNQCHGFFSPAQVTNVLEIGYGRSRRVYYTHECSAVRLINKNIVTEGKPKECHIENIRSYVEQWCTRPFVIKDPLFCYTLSLWIEACLIGDMSIAVIFTHRSKKETLKSWKHAPFTCCLLNSRPEIYRDLKKCMNYQISYCERKGIYHMHLKANRIKEMVRS